MNSVKMIIGNDCVIDNEELFCVGEKAIIVTGKRSAYQSGAFEDVAFNLTMNDIGYEVYDDVKQSPTVSSCIEIAKFAKDNDCDFVIGIGGGSCLDAAKVVSLFMNNESLDEDCLYSKSWKNKRAPLILVGTTAGTGSEVTKVSVLTDKSNRKHSITDDELYADVSFGDPRYTYSLNKKYMTSTGIDALAHLVESYFSNNANDESRKYSREGIKLVYPELLSLLENNFIENKQKDNIYKASIKAGYAIDISKTTFAHTLGYYLTENYNIPHGFASFFFLEDLLNYEEENNKKYFDEFIKDIELSKDDLLKLNKLLPDINVHFNVDEVIPRWENAYSIKNTYGNMNINDIRNILLKHFS